MRLINNLKLTALFILVTSTSLYAQNDYFSNANPPAVTLNNARRLIVPERFRTLSANLPRLRDLLWSLPSEGTAQRKTAPELVLPMPDGTKARFHVWESSIQEPGLAAKFPEIRTFAGQGIDDPYATIRLDYSPYFGFHAQILSPKGNIYIDPYARGNREYYISYYTED